MLFKYEDTAQVSRDEIQRESEKLTNYLDHLNKVAKADNYMYEESSINLPFDEKILERVYKLKKKYVTPELKYVIDIGIGGSNLGTKAVYDALYGHYDVIEPTRFPKMIFVDTNDPTFLTKLSRFLKKNVNSHDEVLINAISKSGKTTETVENLEIILGNIPYTKKRAVITTAYNSDLWKTAQEMNMECLPIPNKVGGRFSVFSSVGLFPLACVGTNLTELLKGAMEARNVCLSRNIFKNPAALSAITIFSNYTKGKLINDNFFFNPELESLGKWYRQLMGESIGKDGKGITPTVSIGSADLHSMGQLYLGGIKDKFFTFVSSDHYHNDISIPKDALMDLLIEVEDNSAAEIMGAILEGIKIAFRKSNLPYIELVLDDISLKSLGQFIQLKMVEMMLLAKLMGVDAFDQPNVESYKKETRKILEKI